MKNDQLYGNELLATIASGMVSLQKQYAGKGPTKCQANWAGDDTLVVLMGGGFTQAEQTLYEGGHGVGVRDARLAFGDTVRERMVRLVEDFVGRTVVAFMSSSHQEPDMAAEIFVFEPQNPEHPARAPDQRQPAEREAEG